MEPEAAILFMIEMGAVVFFFLLLPLIIALGTVGRIWQDNRGTGTIYGGVIFWTILVFGLLLGTFAGLVYAGNQGL